MRIFLMFLLVMAVLAALGSALGWFLGLFQNFHPAMDSFSHFRLHFVAVLALSCLVLAILWSGSIRWFAVGVAVLGVGWLALQNSEGPPDDGPRGALRMVQFNLNYRNQALERVGVALTALDADIVTLQEVPPAHEAALRELKTYPHQTHCFFREYIGGVSILSKHALSDVDCANGEGLVTASVGAPGGMVTVGSVHTYWPWPLTQHAQVDKWTARLGKIWGPVIIAGDFNAAPWSHAVRKVEEASRASVVPGLRMTIGVKGVPIPIDHVLLSDAFCGLSARVGPELGSDHFPVIVEIGRVDPTASTGCSQL